MKYLMMIGLGLALAPNSTLAQAPKVGDVQVVNVISISLQVGSTEKESKKVTYTPPPGWYIRSHEVHCAQKQGQASYSVNTVPSDWNAASEDEFNESYRRITEAAAKVQNQGFWAKLVGARQESLTQYRKASASHHAIVVDAVAKGNGLFQSGGALEMTVTAELVYIGDSVASKPKQTILAQ